MLRALLVPILLLGAPDKELSAAAKQLRIAWASQYEWREDAVKNITLDFTWKATWRSSGGKEVNEGGTGQLVVEGERVLRRHIEGGGSPGELHEALGWVVARYARQPFERNFRGRKILDGGKTAAGNPRIKLQRPPPPKKKKDPPKPPLTGKKKKKKKPPRVWPVRHEQPETFILKNDRIIAAERNFGSRDKPEVIRVDFRVEDMADGYGRMRESYTRRIDGEKHGLTRTLEARKDAPVPMPLRYRSHRKMKGATREIEITFKEPKLNVPDAVVIDPKAADVVRAAWKRRYVLEEDIRLTGRFTRKLEKSLQSRWSPAKVEGEFSVWGLDEIEVLVSEKSVRGRSQRESIATTCLTHIRWLFDLMRPTPFEEEFEGCGFTLTDDKQGTIVRLYGYPRATALLVDDNRIIGALPPGADGAWTRFAHKDDPDGLARVEKVTIEFEGDDKSGRISYRGHKGVSLPKKFQYIAVPGRSRWGSFGVAEYTFSKVKVQK
ncbi:MAG: hypothetical protein ACYTGN_01195 [Planctomycetota bacterium]|jgi:hypothetical protein